MDTQCVRNACTHDEGQKLTENNLSRPNFLKLYTLFNCVINLSDINKFGYAIQASDHLVNY